MSIDETYLEQLARERQRIAASFAQEDKCPYCGPTDKHPFHGLRCLGLVFVSGTRSVACDCPSSVREARS